MPANPFEAPAAGVRPVAAAPLPGVAELAKDAAGSLVSHPDGLLVYVALRAVVGTAEEIVHGTLGAGWPLLVSLTLGTAAHALVVPALALQVVGEVPRDDLPAALRRAAAAFPRSYGVALATSVLGLVAAAACCVPLLFVAVLFVATDLLPVLEPRAAPFRRSLALVEGRFVPCLGRVVPLVLVPGLLALGASGVAAAALGPALGPVVGQAARIVADGWAAHASIRIYLALREGRPDQRA